MAFDQTTRNRLARFVSDTRSLLTEEFTRQLQNDYGLDPKTGEVTDLARLTYLDDARRETARILRDTMEHYLATADVVTPAKAKKARMDVLDRIIREQAFTVLNRLCALRMAEARGLLIESIGQGYQSKGFQLYQRLANAALGEIGAAYRIFLFSVFDEFAVDLAVLFDRFSPKGRLFPRETALLAVLAQINHDEIAALWNEDETIGWLYQYFNSDTERKKMREESSAPRNSRELAVRNQFFTPRYVVEFLTDNTLGRIWYEMTRGETVLRNQCRYLVRRPTEIFLKPGESAPESAADSESEGGENLSQEELLRQPVHIPHRPLKDPREIRLLDPACGSMHFGLYAFDLFTLIYDEAWEIAYGQYDDAKSAETFAPFITFVATFSDKAAFLREVPKLIIERNLHGIDIDPRAAQIAGLSLWLRAQRAWHQAAVKPADRPRITRSNVVCAEPMPGEKELLREFIEQQFPIGERPAFAFLLDTIFDRMTLAGEAGSLLRIEEEIRTAIADAKRLWKQGPKAEQVSLFAELSEKLVQGELRLDLSGITDEQFWERAEQRIYDALEAYAGQAESSGGFQRRLFANDAAQGFAFIDLCSKCYDVVVMNPPFGAASKHLQDLLREKGFHNRDLASDFLTNAVRMAVSGGIVGAITTRTIFFLKGFADWRDWMVNQVGGPRCFLDIGFGVLDAAVEASALTIEVGAGRFHGSYRKALGLSAILESGGASTFADCPEFTVDASSFKQLPRHPFAYWVSKQMLRAFRTLPCIGERYSVLSGGNPRDDFRFIRHWVETPMGETQDFVHYSKGGEFALYYHDVHLQLQWKDDGRELKVQAADYRQSLGWSPDWRALMMNYEHYFSPGITWPRRTSRLSFRFLPKGCVFGDKSPVIQPFDGNLDSLRSLIGYLNTPSFTETLNLMVGSSELAQSFEVGIVKSCPLPQGDPERQALLAGEIYMRLYRRDSINEGSHAFLSCCAPIGIRDSLTNSHRDLRTFHFREERELLEKQAELDRIGATALSFQVLNSQLSHQDFDELSLAEYASGILSFGLGAVFARWDIRYATGERLAPELPDPFAPLPVCPPGMLQNGEGLPAVPEDVPSDYPLRISWLGILVDDENHSEDVIVRVREAIEVIWKDRGEAIEQEACEILGVKSLRDYFRKPVGFFADHLKRYSKSRRQAPIYWPLSTASGSYTLWLYYHRLTDQTLYTCLNDFVEPKLKQVAVEVARLRPKTARSSSEERELERLSILVLELQDFRTELLRIAQFWRPNLNDGVQITAAPLWQLFRLPKWQKTLKETWEKLEAGEYDWAHLALSVWPDRVVRASNKDRSVAIAHELEDRLWHEVEVEKKSKGGKVKKVTEWQPRDLTEAELKTIIAEVQTR